MSAALEEWIERQYPLAVRGMLKSISPLEVLKERPGFGQRVRAQRGAIVASPVPAAYDPDPDYFFHWYRDSALVIDALRLVPGAHLPRSTALRHFGDFVQFSLSLERLDGRSLIADRRWRARVAPEFERFVRADEELAHAYGAGIGGETRVNPDGTLDISRWPRPQHDGPALRALALLRWCAGAPLPDELRLCVSRLLRADLSYALEQGGKPCFDIWEEEQALHYYTQSVAAAALREGAAWLDQEHNERLAEACRSESQALHARLDDYWSPEEGYYRSRLLASGERSSKELDIAVILAAIHTGGSAGLNGGGAEERHGVRDARLHATLERLAALFDALYSINRARDSAYGPALGRYRDDSYYSGGAYYFATLAAAEFCFRAASAHRGQAASAQTLIARGDSYLRTVCRFTPASGELSEQFDQRSGAQTSAKQLSWSYAAFISCIAARHACMGHAAG